MIKILVVEDDTDINFLLYNLLSPTYHVIQAFSGAQGLQKFSMEQPDLLLLDLMLPDIGGEEVIAMIRKEKQTPIIVITAKGDVNVLVDVLNQGADDYIAKPFNTKELMARIAKQVRQVPGQIERYQVGELVLDVKEHRVCCKTTEVNLTQKEFELLQCFMAAPTQVFTKANLYEKVWKETYYGDDNTISVHISRLRNKLSEVSGRDMITTIWGVGFKLSI